MPLHPEVNAVEPLVPERIPLEHAAIEQRTIVVLAVPVQVRTRQRSEGPPRQKPLRARKLDPEREKVYAKKCFANIKAILGN